MRKERITAEDGFHDELDNILKDSAKIYREAYHGGDLNGVCCLRLVEKQDLIMKEIIEMCQRRRSFLRPHIQPCTEEEMMNKLNQLSN